MIKFHSFAARLAKALKDGGWKKKDFAKAVGITPRAISRYLHGGAPAAREVVIRMATVLQVTTDWLLTGKAGQHVFTVAEGGVTGVPVLTKIAAGQMESAIDPYPYAGAAEEFLTLHEKNRREIALRVKGRSMEPAFVEGDYIVVDLDARPHSGDLVVAVCDDDGEGAFKKYVKKKDGIVLQPLNDQYKEIPLMPKHRIVGKVVCLVRKIK